MPENDAEREPDEGNTAAQEAEVPSKEASPAADGTDAEVAQGEQDAADAKPAKRAKATKPKWKAPPPDRLDGAVEAMLLVAGEVLKLDRLRDLLGLPSRAPLREAIERIAARWQESGLAVEIEQVAGGVRVVTRPEFAEYVGRLQRRPQSDKLTKSLLETLSIVAYKQPVGRAEVERIRGVQAGEALRGLLERNLLKVVGRSDQPGRPMLYGTTDRFLTLFGMNSLKDLPTDGDLKRL